MTHLLEPSMKRVLLREDDILKETYQTHCDCSEVLVRRDPNLPFREGAMTTTTEAVPSSSYSLDAYTTVYHTQAQRRKSSDSSAGAVMQQAENLWKPSVISLLILRLVFLPALLVPPNNSDPSHLNWLHIDTKQDAVRCSQELYGSRRFVFAQPNTAYLRRLSQLYTYASVLQHTT